MLKWQHMVSWQATTSSNKKFKLTMAGFSFNHVGRGLGPKWRALRDINIGDELVCNYASEHFTRFDADVFRIDNPVAHEKPLRPLKTPKRHKVDKLKQGTGVQCSQENIIPIHDGPYNAENVKHRKFSDFVDLVRERFDCHGVDLRMFQLVRDSSRKVIRRHEILVQNYDMIATINGAPYCRHTPTGMARIIYHNAVMNDRYFTKINGWNAIRMYIPRMKQARKNKGDSMIELSNLSFTIGDMREASGLVELKVQNLSKNRDQRFGKIRKILESGGCNINDERKLVRKYSMHLEPPTKHLVKLAPHQWNTEHKRRTVGKRARQTGRESIETVKRRPGRPRLPQSLKRKSNKIEKKSKLRLQRKHFIIEAGFPPIPSPRHDNASSVNLCNGRANQHSRQKKCDENSFENNQVTSMYCGHSDITTDFEAAQMLLSF